MPVRGVVCFPGAGRVEGSSGKAIWVLKPEALEKWIQQEERNGRPVGKERQKTVAAVVCGVVGRRGGGEEIEGLQFGRLQ